MATLKVTDETSRATSSPSLGEFNRGNNRVGDGEVISLADKKMRKSLTAADVPRVRGDLIRQVIFEDMRHWYVGYVGNSFVVAKWELQTQPPKRAGDPPSRRWVLKLLNEKDAKAAMRRQKVELPEVDDRSGEVSWKWHNKLQVFLDSPLTDEKLFNNLVFEPWAADNKPAGADASLTTYEYDDAEPYRTMNIFRGWGCQPTDDAEGKDCQRILWHIENIICDGNKQMHEWLLDWLAHKVQYPQMKLDTAFVMRGEQGIGKGAFATWIVGKIFGDSFIPIINTATLFAKHNSDQMGGLMTFLDEAFFAGDKSIAGQLKGLVSEEYLRVEPKYKDAYTVANLTHYIISTNNRKAVPAERKDRRYCVTDVSDMKRGDRKYFNELRQECENGGVESFFGFLLAREIKSDLRTVPQTKALTAQKLLNLDSVEAWWHACLSSGHLIGHAAYDDHDWNSRIATLSLPRQDLFNAYTNYATKKKRFLEEDESIGQTLREICPSIRDSRPRDSQKGRQWAYILPKLEEARADFEQWIGGVVEWPDSNGGCTDEDEPQDGSRTVEDEIPY